MKITKKTPHFAIAAVSGDGTQALCESIMTHIETMQAEMLEQPELTEMERKIQAAMQTESRMAITALAEARRRAREAGDDEEWDDDWDDGDVEVEYVR